MKYRFCGKSGLQLPFISLGMWHNFGDTDRYATMKEIAFKAFNEGITHFDLANNYGPPPRKCRAEFQPSYARRFENPPRRDNSLVKSRASYVGWSVRRRWIKKTYHGEH